MCIGTTVFTNNMNIITISFILEILIFFQCFSLLSTFSRLERTFNEYPKIAKYYPLIMLGIKIILLTHFIAIFYIAIAQFEIEVLNESDTWIQL